MRPCRAALAAAVFVLCACGGGSGRRAAEPAGERGFPMTAVPPYLTAPEGRAEYLSEHYWDRFLDTARVYPADSALLNGVSRADVEQAMGNYAYLLGLASLPAARRAMLNLYRQMEAFTAAARDTAVFRGLAELTERYFYDPNSPLRNEDLYQPFASQLAASPLVSPEAQGRYAYIAERSLLNQTGAPAADFAFIDAAGQSRTLYGIPAEYLLLIFGNPGCEACQQLATALSGSASLMERIYSGRLKVADIYIDEDVALWRAHLDDYPPYWIHGYDPALRIRTDLLYHVRAIPSLYLLDSSKRVLLKDAPPERLLAFLEALP